MKNKSTRHKEENIFKFQPFSERLSAINIDVFHRVDHAYASELDENICYFYQDLEKWEVLNLTEGFASFKKEIRADLLVTLPQLIHDKDRVVNTIIRYLRLKDSLYLQPLLSITASLAKDLRKEFYEYYPIFYNILLELLETKDADQLEWVFSCLAYFFKYLWRLLINDITKVFSSLLPLLSDNKPEYITNFAAESFAFIARKVKDRKSFLNLLVKTVQNKQEGIRGCGRLLFEIIKGVNGQFHSCTEEILAFLFNSLSDPDIHQDCLLEILEYTIAHTVDYVNPQGSDIFWKSILTQLDKLTERWKNDKNYKCWKDLENLLKLLGQAIEYKNGKLLQESKLVIQRIVNVLNAQDLPEEIILILVKISIVILLSSRIRLPQEEASFLVQSILSIKNEKIILYFVDNITEFSLFEALILPHFLKILKTDTDYFRVLTNIVLKKAPLCTNGIKLKKWSKYPLDINSNERHQEIESMLLKSIDVGQVNVEQFFCTVVCITHFNFQEKNKFKEFLGNVIEELFEQCGEHSKKKLFLLNLAVESLLHLKDIAFFESNFQKFLVILLISLNEGNAVYLLSTLSLIIASIEKSLFTMDVLYGINKYLEPYFNSPYHEIRLQVTFIYSFFEDIPEFILEHSTDPEVPREKFKIFSICYMIESTNPQIHTYRDQVLNMEKLYFDKPQMIMCNQTEFKSIPLRYMCGVLFINFQLLWEPILKIIESHAHGLNTSHFWHVYGEQLKKADNYIEDEIDLIVDQLETNYATLGQVYGNLQQFQSKPDFVNHRLLLWKGLVLFPDVAEMKTRDISVLFLNFYYKEFTKYNPELALTWNIKQNNSVQHEEILNEDEEKELDEETDKEDSPISKNPNKTSKINGKIKLKTFLQYLSVFSKIKSPKSMYRESELNKLYYDLLLHKNADIQKAALDCLMTYKQKFLIPYKENLYNLVDDKNFKNELATFNVDREGSSVLEEYREDLMSVVIRIVYSKMNAKIGLRTGGKSAGQHRRTLVIRFLGGCHEREKILFIKMVFRYFHKYLDEDFDIFDKNVNLEKFIPPKRLQSSINMLNVILEHFGDSLASELLTKLLTYIHIIGAFIKAAFQQMSNVHAGFHSSLKVLKNSSIKLLHIFFEKFQQYEWSNKQIKDTFNIFVWPYLDKLNTEGIHSPTVLLKLFILWGSNPRYFPLLVKQKQDDENQFILPKIMELLLNKNSHYSVIHAILEMIEKLLILQPDEEDIRLKLPVDDILVIEQSILDRIKVNDKLNYGSCILLRYIPSVLSRIQISLERKSKSLNKRELFILSRISELVWEADISEQTLQLLLPVVIKKCSGHSDEDIVNQFLTSVKNLLQNVANPSVFLEKVAPLFAEVTYSSARKILISIIDIIVHKNDDSNFKILKNVMIELNAFDAKWIDQPDFQRRHDAFKEIHSLIQENTIDLKLGILLIFNSYYILSNEKDLSLKENSSRLLKTLCAYLLKKYQMSKQSNDCLLETIFNLIRKGMKNRNDDLRNECISLLGHLAKKCPENNFILRDLHLFTNDIDPEVDFFENLIHLQIHRHARAMTKFCQILKEQTSKVNPQTLTRFVLPLASFYLCNEKYASKNSVVDAAIETVGIICRLLPWHQYEGLLKYYLSKLRGRANYQKQLVRLTVAILDSFHFDLRKAYEVNIDVINTTETLEDETKDNLISAEANNTNEDAVDGEQDVTEEQNNFEEDVDEILENLANKNEALEDAEENVETVSNICDKITVLCKSTATRVIYTIQTILLPQLHKTLAQMTHRDTSHKINRKNNRTEQEEEDLIKVPISLAVVKLLQRLPQQILENNLPGIFMKTCTFLKSHLESVRRAARETLQSMMLTLGPTYLDLLLAEMLPLLQRGFQAHVLVFTVHGVLNCLKEHYKLNDVDKVLLTVLKLCNTDLFGVLSEEKEITKIKVKTSEAKSSKSLDIYQILAHFISEKCLMDLILPIKKILESSTSFKTVYKAQECLRCIAIGLVENQFISTESLLKFAYGIASEKIPQLIPGKNKQELTEKEINLLKRQKPDCYIIPKAPVGRTGIRVNNVKNFDKANAHILVEFGLRLCFILLKRDRLKEEEFRPFMDPFVVLFKDCLNSKHIKLCTVTLQCLNWIFKYELPSLREHIKQITSDMFSILHKYAAAGLSKGDNFDLVVAAFKAMSVLLRDVKYHTIEQDQLKVLLLYVEQDMNDYDRQAVAFNLLKAILTRKLIVPEIHDIMERVAELSIISELNHVRSQSRSVFHQFLMDYPLGKNLEKHVSFYLSQTSFEMQHGRESALEMIQTLINSFPLKTLISHSGTILITLGARLVNEEVPELRKTVATSLTFMLNRLPKADRQPLFEIVMLWFADRNISHRRLAAQLCGIFVNVEKTSFEARLPVIIPVIMKQFGMNDAPGKFVKLKKDEEPNDEEKTRIRDHHYFQVLQLLLKLCAQCPKFLKLKDTTYNFASHCQSLLNYPHDWVRLSACQFLGFVLSSIDVDHLSHLLLNGEQDDLGYLTSDPHNSLKSLTLDLCDQLQPENLKTDLAEQVIKNLVFIAKVLQKIPINNEDSKKINLYWLCKKLRKIINSEIVESSTSVIIRTEIFKWIAGVTTALESEAISPVLYHLMAPLVREMLTTEESNAPLRQLSKEVGNIIKKKVGFEAYTETLSKLQQTLSIKRAERKRSRNQLAVVDPELHAKKKLKRNEKKKDVKKRKTAELKGVKKNFKKRKVADLEDN